MNRCQANLSIGELLQIFLDRFQVFPQHTPFALHMGWTHLVRFVRYNPMSPFSVEESGCPFASEGDAQQFCRTQLEHAVDRISQFSEEERERLVTAMLREDDAGICKVHATYDALLLKYFPVLMPALSRHVNITKKRGKIALPPAPSLEGLDDVAAKVSKTTPKVLAKLDGKFTTQLHH